MYLLFCISFSCREHEFRCFQSSRIQEPKEFFLQIYVQAEDFNGLRTLQQHKLIKNILKDDVANMHGLTIKTEPTNR